MNRLNSGVELLHIDETHPSPERDDTSCSLGLQIVLDRPEQKLQRQAIAAALFGRTLEAVAIGRFRVLRQVGEGGMGTVYAAHDERLDRKVAVKLVRTSRFDSTEVLERTLREARALARISHPNVVHVYEVGEFEGQLFVAMEFLAGPTLRAWLDESPRPWQEVLTVMRAAGEGLAAAHAEGVVHRDFKPHNVMFGADARVRVLDFGLARFGAGEQVGARLAQSLDLPQRPITMSGALLGTPAYMAPEQLDGKPADVRSDIFGFCVTLYEALYGKRPFTGETLGKLIEAVTGGRVEEPPPGVSVPIGLRKVVLRGLAADPANRPASMRELLDALADDPARRRRRWSVLGGGIGLLGVGAWMLGQALEPAPSNEWKANAERLAFQSSEQRAKGNGVEALGLAIEAAALVEAHSSDPDSRIQAVDRALFEASAAELDWGPIAEFPGFADRMQFSPDSTRLALARRVSLFEVGLWELESDVIEVYDLGVDEPALVLRDHGCSIGSLEFGADGSVLMGRCHEGDDMHVWNAKSGESIASFAGQRSPVFSSRGLRVASVDDRDIALTSAASGQVLARLSGHETRPTLIEFDANGEVLATGGIDQDTRVWDAASGSLTMTLEGSHALAARFFVDGSDRIVTLDADRHVRVWTAGVGEPLAGEVSLEQFHALEVSPEGRRVALQTHRSTWLWDVGTGERITTIEDHSESPVDRDDTTLRGPRASLRFSPDGSRLLTRRHDRRIQLFASDSGRSVAKTDLWTLGYDFSPDGALLALGFGAGFEIWDPASGTRSKSVVAPIAEYPTFSPDGRMFVSHGKSANDEWSTRVWSTTRSPSTITKISSSFNPAVGVAITADALLFTATDGLARGWDVESGAQLSVLRGHGGPITAMAASGSPDADYLATASVDATVRVWSPSSGKQLALLEGHAGPVRALEFTPDGSLLGSASDDHFVRIWDPKSGGSRGEPLEHPGPVSHLEFGPDGSRLVTTSGAFAFVWDPRSSRLIAQTRAHEDEVESLAFGSSGMFFATHDGERVRVWDASSGELLHDWLDPRGVPVVEFSPDGRRLATTSGVWDASSGVRLVALDEVDDLGKYQDDLEFSPEGGVLVLGPRAWNAYTGQLLADFQSGHETTVRALGVLKGGERLVTVSADALILRDLLPPRVAACQRLRAYRVAYAKVADACESP